MVLRNISIRNYGPIDDLSYTFRFDKAGNPVPLVLIGKNGCGKTSLLKLIAGDKLDYQGTLRLASGLTFSVVSQDTSGLQGSYRRNF